MKTKIHLAWILKTRNLPPARWAPLSPAWSRASPSWADSGYSERWIDGASVSVTKAHLESI